MSDRYIVIPGWEKFQHKDIWRKSKGVPPWIKVYTALLYDDDYIQLSQRLRGLLHGIWLLYAASGGVVPASPSYISRMLGLESEWAARARRERGESVAREGRDLGEGAVRSRDLKSLEQAGFIEFKARPTRYSVAPRVEESREEPPLTPPATQGGNGSHPRRASTKGYTGCRQVRGTHGVAHVHDSLGKDRPPPEWPHEKPTRDEVREALAIQAADEQAAALEEVEVHA